MIRVKCMMMLASVLLLFSSVWAGSPRSHPRLLADSSDIALARARISESQWYRSVVEEHKQEIEEFLKHRPIYVSPVKQIYQFKMYTCPVHDTELLYEEFRPFDHRCPKDTNEAYRGGKYDAAWAGWYNRQLADHLLWCGILYQLYQDPRYADAGREILMQFADLYLKYPTANTILGPAHVFFGTLSESFWGVDMTYGYDLLYSYRGFTEKDRLTLKENLFYPLAKITQQFPESASNRQLWYNNVSAAVGFLYDDQDLIRFALKGTYGFEWQLGSALPESGFWPEWSGYHFVALRGMIHLAEMARHNGLDLYHMEIAGRTMKRMFDSPFELILPNYEFPRSKDSGGGNLLEYTPFYEVGYAVYHDPRYLALLTITNTPRGTQVVGETSAIGRSRSPITIFHIEPDLARDTTSLYPDHSVNLRGNGFAILRNGRGSDRRYLYLDYGIMGGEHGHPDRLQIGYYARGQNWIVDPLNETYFNPNLQLWYRQSIAHNTPVVNQTTQTWSNGEGVFFGSLPTMQVAGGRSSTIYPGATLTRTLVQVGEYFIDLFDFSAGEPRLVDWPLHGSGSLIVNGATLHKERSDLFGPEPGIPGYDQLKEIRSARTDSAWNAVFENDDGEKLGIFAIGEPGTRLFTAMTPPLGGFYKQMVKDQSALPMIFSRRKSARTRFAHAVQAFTGEAGIQAFYKGREPNTFVVETRGAEDFLFADSRRSEYSLVRIQRGKPVCSVSFNMRHIDQGGRRLLSSETVLNGVECRWEGKSVSLAVSGPLVRIKVFAPGVDEVQLNDHNSPYEREGDFIVLTGEDSPVIEFTEPGDSILYSGTEARIRVRIWNPTHKRISGRLSMRPDSSWAEMVKSQREWWGGVVNLKATNKHPVERITMPAEYQNNGSWCDVKSIDSITVRSGEYSDATLSFKVPGDAPQVQAPTVIAFGEVRIKKTFVILPPLVASITFPNAQKEILNVTVQNLTPKPQSAQLAMVSSREWTMDWPGPGAVTLAAGETRTFKIPARLSGYSEKSQLYSVTLTLRSGEYVSEIVRDMYVTTAHFAKAPPSLTGDWKGWNRARPATIDQPDQVCKLLLGNQPWAGPEDLSARLYAMYDRKYLYVGADVTDNVLVTHWDFPAMSYPWDTDCMEVILDTRTSTEQGHDPPTPGLYRDLSLAEYKRTEFGPERWRGGGAGGPLLPKPLLVPGAETYFTARAGGYIMISRYPLSRLKNIVARPGYKIGFDVGLSDNDGTTYRKNLHIWAGFTQNQSWWDMGTIGALVFGPDSP